MFFTLFSLSAESCIKSLSKTTTTTDNGNACPPFYETYFKLYRVLVGDISFGDFANTPTIVNLYLLFTFVSTVIIVNMLIAKAYDAYEKSATRGPHLFGRARLIQVAQTDAFEVLLHPMPKDRNSSLISSERIWKHHVMTLFVVLQLFMCLDYVVFFILFFPNDNDYTAATILLITVFVGSFLLVVGLTFTTMLFLVLSLLLLLVYLVMNDLSWIGGLVFILACLQVEFISLVMTGWRDDWKERRWPCFKYLQYNFLITYIVFWPIYWFVNWILLGRLHPSPGVLTAKAVKKANATGATTDVAVDENGEWKKRLDIVRDHVRLTVSKSETEIESELGNLTARIHQLESNLKHQTDQVRKGMDNQIERVEQRLKLHHEELLTSFKERIVSRLSKGRKM